ncbi:5-formyltetrahydrofolate cyclo-ligase [Roseibacterium elongatum DSM 19469]|uniref:5-formyltetrahydrofolate cyclo-ligase n=1 Tax=Roseicyclus elongatus DSM 19469 TaxID=1294273 RepID=W8RY38_9RHOB|nr:5-formyltetrahydrofolate cyclo-ligase [Roseibacterium elongatum]AHM02762.1 5-formyltetrahydrofolate cyclo-ligase [Roseibacterium elongatum DSM 19469]
MSHDDKALLRKRAYAARKQAHDAGGPATQHATQHVLAAIGAAAGRTVAGYMPIRTEIDPLPAMTALHEAGSQICVPVIAGNRLPLEFRAWAPGCVVVEGPFGAKVPKHGDWVTPEVLIVPLVGFDAARNRLGYGGGFYDRTLARLRAAGPVRAIGLAYAAQQLPPLPVEPTDERLDAIVTERGVIRS